jgi:hypothetical protein
MQIRAAIEGLAIAWHSEAKGEAHSALKKNIENQKKQISKAISTAT